MSRGNEENHRIKDQVGKKAKIQKNTWRGNTNSQSQGRKHRFANARVKEESNGSSTRGKSSVPKENTTEEVEKVAQGNLESVAQRSMFEDYPV